MRVARFVALILMPAVLRAALVCAETKEKKTGIDGRPSAAPAGAVTVGGSGAIRDFELTVAAGRYDRTNTPVRAVVRMPAERAGGNAVALTGNDGRRFPAQLTGPSLLFERLFGQAAGPDTRELHFVLPGLRAGQFLTMKAAVSGDPTAEAESFHWVDTPGEFTELRLGNRPIMRYMYKAYDDRTTDTREQTYKPYHHLFNPAGTRLVTKGVGGQDTHHRGLFYGFRIVNYDDKTVDVWHCIEGAHQSHLGFLASEAGPVVGRHRVLIGWYGKEKSAFAEEEREMAVYNVPGGILVEFASRLRSTVGKLHLDGDPQHAGFHFRVDNEVAARTSAQTYFVRPDGVGKLNQERNWPDVATQVNLPWNAMSFVLGGRRYTAAYLDQPTNPKEARYSERLYGRFGSYFVHDLEPSKTLDLDYRVWLQDGEMTVPQVAALDADFVEPPAVSVKW